MNQRLHPFPTVHWRRRCLRDLQKVLQFIYLPSFSAEPHALTQYLEWFQSHVSPVTLVRLFLTDSQIFTDLSLLGLKFLEQNLLCQV